MAVILPESHVDRLVCLLYHKVTDEELMQKMDRVRQEYVNLASFLVNHTPECRSKSLALTHLEESCTRAIQALALQGKAEIQAY